MFEAINAACLMSSLASSDPDDWLTATEVLRIPTANGARANPWAEAGGLAPGAIAHLIVLNPRALAFQRLNDPSGQTVFWHASFRSFARPPRSRNRRRTQSHQSGVIKRPDDRGSQEILETTAAGRDASSQPLPHLRVSSEQALSGLESLGMYWLVPDRCRWATRAGDRVGIDSR